MVTYDTSHLQYSLEIHSQQFELHVHLVSGDLNSLVNISQRFFFPLFDLFIRRQEKYLHKPKEVRLYRLLYGVKIKDIPTSGLTSAVSVVQLVSTFSCYQKGWWFKLTQKCLC